MEKVPQYLYPCAIASSPTDVQEEGWVFGVVFGPSNGSDFRLSEHFLEYIFENALCTRCLEIIGEARHLGICSRPARTESSWSRPRNRMFYISAENSAEFRKFWSRERARFRNFDRKLKLSQIPLPPEGILLQLKDRQENRCYYCFNELGTSSSDLKPHLDHFVAVANGGSNSIFNLVYACARCNQEKFRENGEQFIEQRMPIKRFPNDKCRDINRMRKSVKEWKEQFRPKYLSQLERLREEHYCKMPRVETPEFSEWLEEENRLLLRWGCIRGEIR